MILRVVNVGALIYAVRTIQCALPTDRKQVIHNVSSRAIPRALQSIWTIGWTVCDDEAAQSRGHFLLHAVVEILQLVSSPHGARVEEPESHGQNAETCKVRLR